jgi:predicted  nucleic acid-binding Zn-ribbon protein
LWGDVDTLKEKKNDLEDNLQREKRGNTTVQLQVSDLQETLKNMETQATRDQTKLETLLEENRLLTEKVANTKKAWLMLKNAGESLDM